MAWWTRGSSLGSGEGDRVVSFGRGGYTSSRRKRNRSEASSVMHATSVTDLGGPEPSAVVVVVDLPLHWKLPPPLDTQKW